MISGLTVIARLNDDNVSFVLLVPLLFMLVLMLLVGIAAVKIFRPWIQAYTSGCPVSVLQILTMKMRRVDAQQVIRCAVLAKQAGCHVAWRDLESAFLQGVDLEKVTLAYVESRRSDKEWKSSDLVDAERRMRLADMLGDR